jgi:hypothetical protein
MRNLAFDRRPSSSRVMGSCRMLSNEIYAVRLAAQQHHGYQTGTALDRYPRKQLGQLLAIARLLLSIRTALSRPAQENRWPDRIPAPEALCRLAHQAWAKSLWRIDFARSGRTSNASWLRCRNLNTKLMLAYGRLRWWLIVEWSVKRHWKPLSRAIRRCVISSGTDAPAEGS